MGAPSTDKADESVISAKAKNCFRGRVPLAFAFVQARLASAHSFGLHMGCVILVGALWLFAGIAEDVITGDPLVLIDELISEWFRTHATPRFTQGMHLVSELASTAAVSSVSLLLSCVLLWQRRWYWLLGLVLVVLGGMLLNLLLKELFGRGRPGWADPLMALADPSFPSGHTMMATLTYGFLAAGLLLRVRSWPWRILITTLTILLVFLVALSRMYLGAHYLSDVLAAMAAGMAWLALVLTAVETLRRRNARTAPAGA